jgi:uncharacterized cupin superfamily protein
MKERRMVRIAPFAALVPIAIPLAGALAQTLSPTPVFEGSTTMRAKDGATEIVDISVQSWAIVPQEREIPLRGFYLAHLLSGQISTTSDGQTTEHLPGDYWTVRPGESMQVKALGEVAVLETIVVAKK